MKYLVILLLLSGCSTLPPPMEQSRVNEYMQRASALSGRAVVAPPKIYVIPQIAMFQRLTCGNNCGVGVATAVYMPYEDRILVNAEIVPADRLEDVLMHELVHVFQRKQKDQRPCMYQEHEAYKVQYLSRGKWVSPAIWDYAMQSCVMSRMIK